jgi:large subunit ribosomal protein L5e
MQGFIKVVKNKAYYKRFQVQPRRRRQNKTDYYARKRLIWQDKNKYDTPKYRLVVRFTNRDVITAVVSSDLNGDRVVKSAYGHELRRYGLKFGFKSWPATYATGLLLARRINAYFKLPFQGKKDAAGEFFNLGEVDDFPVDDSGVEVSSRRPFKAILDVGLHRTTTGSRLFAAVKGACDGGINVPHSPTRFPGAPKSSEEEINFEVVRDHIFGKHIGDYMTQLSEEDEEAYALQFAEAKKAGITGDKIEEMWTKIQESIRAESAQALLKPKKDEKQLGYFGVRTAPKTDKKFFKNKKFSKEQRVARVATRLAVRDYRIAARAAAKA